MKTSELIREIKNLPIQKRIYVIEKSIHSMRKNEEKIQMKKAADLMLLDYTNDAELTVFTKN